MTFKTLKSKPRQYVKDIAYPRVTVHAAEVPGNLREEPAAGQSRPPLWSAEHRGQDSGHQRP